MGAGLFWCLVALVVAAPLPLGANRPWAWSLLAVATGVLLVAAAAHMAFERSAGPPRDRWPWPAAAFAGAALWAGVQLLPVVPDAWHDPVWPLAAAALGQPVTGVIAAAPGAGTETLMRVLSYAGVLWLGWRYGRDEARACRALWALASAGAAYAAYGLAAHLSGTNTILWYPKWAYWDALTSTFVNRNSYAAYAGLGLVVVTALLLREFRDAAPYGLLSRSGLRHFADRVRLRLFVLVGLFMVILAALLMTASRGGFAAAAVGLAVFLAAMAAAERGLSRRTPVAVAAVALLAIVLALSSFSRTNLFHRLAADPDAASGRREVYALTAEAIAQRPLLGRGLGAFPALFAERRDERFAPDLPAYDKAHNTYLELAAELGVPATGAVLAGLGLLMLRLCAGALARRRGAFYPCLGLGASALLATHALVDFSPQIPAIAATYALLLGVALAQSRPQRGGAERSYAASERGASKGATSRRPSAIVRR